MISSWRRYLGIVVLACFIAAAASTVYATEEKSVCDGPAVFDFAERLYHEHDYYRAVTEFKRFLFHFPDDREGCERAYFYICRSYFEASRWNDTRESCDGFILNYPDSDSRGEIFFIRGIAEKRLGRFDDAHRSFSYCADISKGYRDRAILQQVLVCVEQEEWRRAGEFSARIPQESLLHGQAVILSEGMKTVETLPRKSPHYAGSFAAVLPGAGHLYTGRTRDALVAFLLNASFIWAAIELFQDEHYVAGGVVSFFEVGWYAGNIYSAVSSAHKYNRDVKAQFLRSLKEKAGPFYDE